MPKPHPITPEGIAQFQSIIGDRPVKLTEAERRRLDERIVEEVSEDDRRWFADNPDARWRYDARDPHHRAESALPAHAALSAILRHLPPAASGRDRAPAPVPDRYLLRRLLSGMQAAGNREINLNYSERTIILVQNKPKGDRRASR
jgi:hypothetical protein